MGKFHDIHNFKEPCSQVHRLANHWWIYIDILWYIELVVWGYKPIITTHTHRFLGAFPVAAGDSCGSSSDSCTLRCMAYEPNLRNGRSWCVLIRLGSLKTHIWNLHEGGCCSCSCIAVKTDTLEGFWLTSAAPPESLWISETAFRGALGPKPGSRFKGAFWKDFWPGKLQRDWSFRVWNYWKSYENPTSGVPNSTPYPVEWFHFFLHLV